MLTAARRAQAARAPNAGIRERRGHRQFGAATGGRPLPARQGRIHRRHPVGRHARSRLRAQPGRACAHSWHPQAGRRRGSGVRGAGSRGRAADRRGVRSAGVQAVRATGAGDRQGASRRRGDRGLCRIEPRRGGGPGGRGRCRVRRIAAGGGHARRARQRRSGCTNTGTTTCSWRRSSRSRRSGSRDRRRSWCGDACERRGSACRRWKAAASLPPGIGGWSNCWSTARPRCRISCAPDWRDASGSSRGGFASWRPMSAAASATRESCCRRKSVRHISRVVSAIRCAGSRIAASSLPATPIVESTTTISRCTPKRTAR